MVRIVRIVRIKRWKTCGRVGTLVEGLERLRNQATNLYLLETFHSIKIEV